VTIGSGILSIPGSVIALFYLLKWYLFPAKNRHAGFHVQNSWILFRPSEYSRLLKMPVKNLNKIDHSGNQIIFSYSDRKTILINLGGNKDLNKIVSGLKQFVTLNL
jgi:hypothetical protein